jgi:CRISPR system Cascade subunit CasB
MSETTKSIRNEKFVKFVIERITQKDNGAVAALKRADNPATEYQSWEYLARFVDIDKGYERLPFATIGSAIAKAKVEQNGMIRIGQAIAKCYDDGQNNGKDNDQAKAKLRRLLACETTEEVCRVLRPLFSLISAKGGIALDYVSLLDNLSYFYFNSQRVKSQWAQDFYRHYELEDNE